MEVAAHPGHSDVRVASVGEELKGDGWEGLEALARDGALHANAARVGQKPLPPNELTAHEAVAADDARRSILRSSARSVGPVEPVHDVSPPKVDRAKVLEKAAQGSVDVKLHPVCEGFANGGACT